MKVKPRPTPVVGARFRLFGCARPRDAAGSAAAKASTIARRPGALVGAAAAMAMKGGPMENSPVVFRVRFGKEIYACKGVLTRDRGALYAIVHEIPDDCPFPPDQVRLEEENLELKHDPEIGDYYQYHGFIFVY